MKFKLIQLFMANRMPMEAHTVYINMANTMDMVMDVEKGTVVMFTRDIVMVMPRNIHMERFILITRHIIMIIKDWEI